MDVDNCNAACGLISRTYIQQGSQALARRRRLIKTLLSQRRLPQQGWDNATIEMLLQVCSIFCVVLPCMQACSVPVGRQEGRKSGGQA